MSRLAGEMDRSWAKGAMCGSPAALWLVQCALAERSSAAADAALAVIPEAGAANPYDNSLTPREWFVGLVARILEMRSLPRLRLRAVAPSQRKRLRATRLCPRLEFT